jgi:hypothetical protein
VTDPVQITPEPTVEEVAAIVAALETARPRGGGPVPRTEPPRWRWSGRWWSKPIPARRVRPW